MTRAQCPIQHIAQPAELENHADLTSLAAVGVFAPDVVGILQRKAAGIGPGAGRRVVICGGEIGSLGEARTLVTFPIPRELRAVVGIGARKVPVVIHAIEVEVSAVDGPEKVLNRHHFVK